MKLETEEGITSGILTVEVKYRVFGPSKDTDLPEINPVDFSYNI